MLQSIRRLPRIPTRTCNKHNPLALVSHTRQCMQQAFASESESSGSEYTQMQWYNECEQDSIKFWKEAAKGIEWSKFPQTIFKPHDRTHQLNYSWYSDGELNITTSMIDRHIANGRGSDTAIIYDSPVTSSTKHITFDELLESVENLSAYLVNNGIEKGDRVLIYMPMIPEALVAMYATARIGAVHCVVFGGFAGPELAKRIVDCTPKMIITASCGKESIDKIIEYKPMLDEAMRLTPDELKPQHILMKQRKDICIAPKTYACERDWDTEIVDDPKYDRSRDGKAVPVKSNDPLYILYTSGTTGSPKGIVREAGGHAVALQWTMAHFNGGNAGDVVMFGSDIGWVVGHSFIAYAQLLNGATTVLFEGKPVGMPHSGAGTLWRLVEQHAIKILFAAPTALRAIRKEDPNGELLSKYNIASLKRLFMAGERCDPNTFEWIQQLLGDDVAVIDHWWQTETGWPVTGTMCGDAIEKKMIASLGSGGCPLPGMMLQCVPALTSSSDEEMQLRSMPARMISDVGTQKTGELVLQLPLPPGTLGGIWNNPQRTFEAYLERYPGYYSTGDTGYRDDTGCIHIMSRVDDIINVAGHRLSIASMEEVIAEHESVAECAVIGANHALKGQIPVGVVIKKEGFEHRRNTVLEKEIRAMMRAKIGAVAAYKETIFVDKLPKTRSGKILRRSLKEIYNTGEIPPIPATIDDVDSLPHFQSALIEYQNRKNKEMLK